MASTLPWPSAQTSTQVRSHLAAGNCVVLPTESAYELAASALHPAVERLRAYDNAAIVISSYAQCLDWLPMLEGAAARLVRKRGPGPYLLRADAGNAFGLLSRLPDAAQRLVKRDGRLAIRWPAQPIWDELRTLGLPLISVAIPDAAKADAACVVEGEAQAQLQPSIIDIDGRRCRMARQGGLTQEELDEYSMCRILFICTGNTCRSPLAESLCTKMLADRLGCTPGELKSRGFCVQSAGLAAMMGSEATSEAVEVARDLGADLSQHRSCMASVDMLLWSDFVFTMTAGHQYTLESVAAPGLPAPRMLSPTFRDIADPIGGALVQYRTCANQIVECLEQRLPEILES